MTGRQDERRSIRSALIVAVLLMPSPRLAAQSAMPPATITSVERLRAIGDSLSPAVSRTAQLGRGTGYTYAVTHRDSSGGLEVHADWTDVFVVQSGSATLLTGGIVNNAREESPGEWRGGTIRGGTNAPIKAGDLVVIPAGTPHQMLLRRGERISYLALKVAATPTALTPPQR
jgi:mannose-6-phosphate isomerase-like protein (cupin superfamily)